MFLCNPEVQINRETLKNAKAKTVFVLSILTYFSCFKKHRVF